MLRHFGLSINQRIPSDFHYVFVPFLRRRAFIYQNKDEKNQILTTNVWLNLVSGRSRAWRLRWPAPRPALDPSLGVLQWRLTASIRPFPHLFYTLTAQLEAHVCNFGVILVINALRPRLSRAH